MLHSVHAPLKHALAVEVSLKWHTSHLSPCTQVNTHKTGFLCSLLIFSRRITLFVSSVFNPSHRVFSLGNKLFSTLFLFTQVKNQRHTSRGTLELTGIPFGRGNVVILPKATETVVGCGHVGRIGSAMRANCLILTPLLNEPLTVHAMVPSSYF